MQRWPLVLLLFTCLAMTGCQSDPVLAQLEQENREQEEQMWSLYYQGEELRQENESLRDQLEETQGRSDSARPARSGPRLAPADSGTARQQPAPLAAPRGVLAPRVELPGIESLPNIPPRGSDLRGSRLPDRSPLPPPNRFPAPAAERAPSWPGTSQTGPEPSHDQGTRVIPTGVTNTKVTRITLSDRMTGGYDCDHRRGDEGVVVVLEPRDPAGRLLAAAAPVSIVVLDPALSGEAARVARWDLTRDEVARRFRKTPHSEGIHLELEWPDTMPVHPRLQLFARFLRDDGQKLEVDRPIDIELPALQAERSLSPMAEQPVQAASPPLQATEWSPRRPKRR